MHWLLTVWWSIAKFQILSFLALWTVSLQGWTTYQIGRLGDLVVQIAVHNSPCESFFGNGYILITAFLGEISDVLIYTLLQLPPLPKAKTLLSFLRHIIPSNWSTHIHSLRPDPPSLPSDSHTFTLGIHTFSAPPLSTHYILKSKSETAPRPAAATFHAKILPGQLVNGAGGDPFSLLYMADNSPFLTPQNSKTHYFFASFFAFHFYTH